MQTVRVSTNGGDDHDNPIGMEGCRKMGSSKCQNIFRRTPVKKHEEADGDSIFAGEFLYTHDAKDFRASQHATCFPVMGYVREYHGSHVAAGVKSFWQWFADPRVKWGLPGWGG